MEEYIKRNPKHFYHIVDPSPWPFHTAMSALIIALGAVMYFHEYLIGPKVLIYGFFYLGLVVSCWFRDIIFEGTVEGRHTSKVRAGLRLGFKLFIVSEIMFFFGFFWAFFHSALSPTIEIGAQWPPVGFEVLNPYGIPLLNTVILIVSGASITWAHHSLRLGLKRETLNALFITSFLAFTFLSFQLYEYYNAPFDISDSIYGSTFYMLTGFHGLHVFIGSVMILVCISRVIFNSFSTNHHLGLEFTVWYWHFVDVVWLFLFLFVYIWGSGI